MLNRAIRIKIRSWLHLPRTIGNDLLELPVRDGGVGVPSLFESVTVQKMGLMQSLLQSSDPVVRFVVSAGLWGSEIRRMARYFGSEVISMSEGKELRWRLRIRRKEHWEMS